MHIGLLGCISFNHGFITIFIAQNYEYHQILSWEKNTICCCKKRKSVMIKVNLGAAFPRLRKLLIANGRRFERGQISNLFGMSIFVIFIANLVGSGIKQTVLMN